MRSTVRDRSAPAHNACGWLPCGVVTGAAAVGTQSRWASSSIAERLKVLRRARHLLADRAGALAEAISPELTRTCADTLASEVLPLLEACKFLERNAAKLLRPKRLGDSGRPLWLGGIQAEIHREPLGHVLVIGPGNFPLFLPGVQTLQALAAGNTVTWKPGAGGAAVATAFAQALLDGGLPAGVLTVTDESVGAATTAIEAKPDKVVFTGSADAGRQILASLASSVTPAVMELSGCDAMVVMPGADLGLVARAVAFGLRLNGGAVCMSPRRLFATRSTLIALRPLLAETLQAAPPVTLGAKPALQLKSLLEQAVQDGAEPRGSYSPYEQRPLLIDKATVHMAITKSDLFAPVLSLLEVESLLHVVDAYAQCDYALTVSIFCSRDEEPRARMLGNALKAGTVLINDIIAPTADPRVPFGGRGASGYGSTRGSEGLLEMTAPKTVIVRRSGTRRHLDATTEADTPLFAAMIAMLHGEGWKGRGQALLQVIRSAASRR